VKVQGHVVYSFPLRLGVSGIGMTAWNQIDSLSRIGWRITAIAASCERPFRNGNVEVIETLRPLGLRIPIRAIGKKRAIRLHDLIAAGIVEGMVEKADAFHGWPLGSSRTLDVARSKGIPTYLERPNAHTRFAFSIVADMYRQLGLSIPAGATHRPDARHLEREEEEYGKADFILCPSDFVKRTFLDEGVAESKLLRHRYGYDPEKFFCTHARSEPFTILFLGHAEPRKGLHFALEAWSRSTAARSGRFLVAGDIEEGYAAYLERYKGARGLAFMGFRPDPNGLLNECHALVLPSIEEGSALVTYEAMACGCIPLVSTSSGAPCEHGKDGLFHDPGDIRTLAGHIDALFSDDALRLRLSEGALKSAATLRWEDAARILAGLYAGSPDA